MVRSASLLQLDGVGSFLEERSSTEERKKILDRHFVDFKDASSDVSVGHIIGQQDARAASAVDCGDLGHGGTIGTSGSIYGVDDGTSKITKSLQPIVNSEGIDAPRGVRPQRRADNSLTAAVQRRLWSYLSTLNSLCGALGSHPRLQAWSEARRIRLRILLGLPVCTPGGGALGVGCLLDLALPPAWTHGVVCAVETIALLLQAALVEDSSGCTHTWVVPVTHSLLVLEHSLNRCCRLLLQTQRAVHVRSAAGRDQQVRLRLLGSRTGSLPLPTTAPLQRLRSATEEALGRIARSYGDVLRQLLPRAQAHTQAQGHDLCWKDTAPRASPLPPHLAHALADRLAANV